MDLNAFFSAEVKTALGCTEPGAVALAAAAAAARLGEPARRIHLRLSANIFKNGKSVGIPGTGGLAGNLAAAALGALAGDAEAGLEALRNITEDDVALAAALCDAGAVSQEIVQDVPVVYAEVELVGDTRRALAVVAGRHDHLAEVRLEGEVVFRAADAHAADHLPPYLADLQRAAFDDLWTFASEVDEELADFLRSGAELNTAVAAMGLAEPHGLGAGHTLAAFAREDDLGARIKAATTAAADVRMAGARQAVMSSAGSGNHGLTAIIPPALAAAAWSRSPRELAEALALSHLVTGAIKARTGRLTPICGCAVAAGAGAAAALVRLAGGSAAQAEQAVALVLSSVLGMICDGAKAGCALKVGTAAAEAWGAHLLALHGPAMRGAEGVVDPDFRRTSQALGELSSMGFAAVDVAVLRLLQR
ncbi:UPF0597 protein yhaM [Desulfovibrio sp. X2]|uniref:L-serine ammonia-lyase, iron-sulfur-dependent, subunit alpha n=1 Tax=Desulfovibrio sp. X2 TaxID=941449 RepID=UPI000358F264|nr:L-serine ammonia-lyase, iron-sulfur-dependent, subunit alpha [Desulfovibrio sp. X2]EPR43570.1 UPF0597 protein yhaM [Desulfovibrio sp. X2]